MLQAAVPVQENRRPRAQTDITERKAPRKVSYHVDDEHFGLGTVVEELLHGSERIPGYVHQLVSEELPPGVADAAQMMRLQQQLQAHAAGSHMAAAAAAASLNPLLAPPLPLPHAGYYPGISPWPGLHSQAFLPGALPPPLGVPPTGDRGRPVRGHWALAVEALERLHAGHSWEMLVTRAIGSA
eukprot:Skav219513  [mRNA]  locus=scaffold3561:160006:169261:- [translate_table: standard]